MTLGSQTVLLSTAHAGTLKGHVTVAGAGTRPLQGASVDPYAGQLGSLGATHMQGHVEETPKDVVIYLEGTSPGPAPGGLNPKLYQIRQNFEPRVLGIPVGTTVEFPNEDRIFHNVFSYSKTKRFDLGYYGKGKSRSVTFDKPGLVRVFCDIHSNMAAYIYVVDTPYVTTPDEQGDFEIAGVPEGQYTLKTWHPTRGTQTHTVSIGGGITSMDLDL